LKFLNCFIKNKNEQGIKQKNNNCKNSRIITANEMGGPGNVKG